MSNSINNNTKKTSKKKTSSKTKKMTSQFESNKRLNEDFAKILSELDGILMGQGEPFKARAYKKAEETILTITEDITSHKQLIGKPGIGEAILKKLKQFEETGSVPYLERERNNPINLFTKIHGVGFKKAKELVEDKKITTIEELKNNTDLLNNVQKKGLQYYDDLNVRIPRDEINEYKAKIDSIFENLFDIEDVSFEIVGSYRRGLSSSGDIDLIITSKSNNKKVFEEFLDALIEEKVLIEVLSRGKTKSLTIGKLENKIARRLDFLYSPPHEYAFSTLYFTGSKAFNTVMRQHALNLNLTLNEHGFHKMEGKKKGEKIEGEFNSEEDIFNYLHLKYKSPSERKDGTSIQVTSQMPIIEKIKKIEIKRQKEKKNKSLKVKKTSPKTVKKTSPKTTKKTSPKTVKKTSPKTTKKTSPKTTKKTSPKTTKKTSPKTTKKTSPKLKLPEEIKIKRKKIPKREIKMYIQQFLQKNIDYLEKLDETTLIKMIEYANEQYYNEKPSMTDNEYDILKEFIEKKYPKNKALEQIGAPIVKNSKNKVTLPYFMGSMDKIKPTTNAIEKYIEKYPNDYVLSVKLDGVSGLFSSENGEYKLYTRGDGKVGQDISYLIPYLRLPKKENITIRGEFIITKDLFEKYYSKDFKNSRNFVSGIMNSKKVDPNVLKNIDFVAYEVIKPSFKPLEQMKFLESLDVKTVHYIHKNDISNDLLSEYLVSWRDSYSYLMDGVIVTHNEIYPRIDKNPDHAFAFKMVLTDQVAEAKVLDVIWSASKDGYLKPRIRIEPIELGGVKIEYATAFNAAYIEAKKLNLGALVKIIRSGDVIPYILEVVEPAVKGKMPDEDYYWNDTHIDIILKNKGENEEVLEKNITIFFQTLKVKQLSEGTVRKLIKGGHRSICAILDMSKDDFLKIDGIQEKTATNLKTNITTQVEKASLPILMTASNKFEHGFGTKKFEKILEAYPEIIVSNESKEEKINKLSVVKSLGEKTATNFVNHIEDFKTFLENCKLVYKLEVKKDKEVKNYDVNHVLFQKNIVMTGFRDDEFITMLKDKYQVKQGSSISKNTFVLLVKDKDDVSSKIEKATSLNIPIMTKEEFMKEFLI